ncbi:T9SS type A sorting domain-containing protein [Flavobacterium tructae]|uniref:T9SS type A sorting domain-containing protein n=1 Tax=Flavobacterium tructae TaxID=1114873 RepID=UPI002551E3DD|nr:T9SS type A sorting domain-containing protein [Flavobacterium tructae]MDL2141711.1 T9SS type A sorting domain-containing protein [Flavobacterium tructae]
MRIKIQIVIILVSLIGKAQTNKVVFEYDNAGNQIKRYLCLNCPSTTGKNDAPKEIEELTQEDLLQFSQEDLISYYPNPVKEELFLNWKFTNDKFVNNIQVFSITGQLLKAYPTTLKNNSQNISFQNYPAGIYAVLLYYSDGDKKSIKIIKK